MLERRRRIARAAEIGQRMGYTLFGVAVGLFVYGFVVDFVPTIVNAIVVCLAVGSVLLRRPSSPVTPSRRRSGRTGSAAGGIDEMSASHPVVTPRRGVQVLP